MGTTEIIFELQSCGSTLTGLTQYPSIDLFLLVNVYSYIHKSAAYPTPPPRLAGDCAAWWDHCHSSDGGPHEELWAGLRFQAKMFISEGKCPPVSGLLLSRVSGRGRPSFVGGHRFLFALL